MSEQTKHAPQRYGVRPSFMDEGYYEIFNAPKDAICRENSGGVVHRAQDATVQSVAGDDAKAKAVLFAAAPELLEALQEAIDLIGYYGDGSGSQREFEEKCEGLIAKATGNND